MKFLFSILLALTAVCPPPAPAQINAWDNVGETEDTPGAEFLRRYGKYIFLGLPVAMFVLYVMIMGPADVWDAAQRVHASRHRGLFNTPRGFGNSGGFGGDPSKNPWD